MRILLDPTGAPGAPAAIAEPSMPDDGEMNAAIDALGEERDAEPVSKPTPPPSKPTPPPAKKTEPTPPKATEKPATPPPAEKPKSEGRKLGEAYEALKAEFNELKAKHEALEKRPPPKPEDFPEYKTLAEKHAAEEKLRRDYEERLRYADYQNHPEFTEKYKKPFEDAFNEGRKTVSELTIVDPKTQEERSASPEDFDRIMAIGDNAQARKVVKEMFPEAVDAQAVLDARKEVQRANKAMQDALTDFKTKGGEVMRQRQEQMAQGKKAFDAAFQKVVADDIALPNNAVLFKPDEDDAEAAGLFDKAAAHVDQLFNDELRGKLAPQDLLKLRAEVRNTAIASHILYRKLKLRDAKIKTLQEELDAIHKSTPGTGEGQGQEAAVGEETGEQALASDKYTSDQRA